MTGPGGLEAVHRVGRPLWMDEFHRWSLSHWICLMLAAIVLWSTISLARRLRDRHSPLERTLRTALGIGLLLFGMGYWAYFLRPSHFDWAWSLPLQLCDMLVGVSAFSLLLNSRWLTTVTVFWGLAFASIAYVHPIVRVGPAHAHFWFFWVGHLVITLAVLYHLLVCRYRPTLKDLLLISAIGAVYGVAITPINLWLEANYGFLGNTPPGEVPPIDAFGPWPQRLVLLWALHQVLMVAIWAALSRRSPLPSALTLPVDSAR